MTKRTICGFRLEVDTSVPAGTIQLRSVDAEGRPCIVGQIVGIKDEPPAPKWVMELRKHLTGEYNEWWWDDNNITPEKIEDFIRAKLEEFADDATRYMTLEDLCEKWGLRPR